MGLFADFAERYHQVGIQPIPVSPGTKACHIPKWNKKFGQKLLTEHDLEDAIKYFGSCDIGILCGKVSGLIGIDFDFEGESAKVLENLIIGALPPCPVIKKGSKGWTRFYKYSPEIRKTAIKRGPDGFIDILSDFSITVMPPTPHKNGKDSYHWLTPDTLLDLDLNDIPSLNMDHLDVLRSIAEMKSSDLSSMGLHFSNRHDCIFGFVFKHSNESSSLDELIQATLSFDLTFHEQHPKGPYFKDPKYLKNELPLEVCTKLVTRMVDWKKRKLASQSIDWDIGRSQKTYFINTEKGQKFSTKYEDFEDFFNTRFADAKKCILRKSVQIKQSDGLWTPLCNIGDAIESYAAEVGLAPTWVKRHLARWSIHKQPEFLFEIGRHDQKTDPIKELFSHVSLRNFSFDVGLDLFKEWMGKIFQRVENPEIQNRMLIMRGRQNLGKDYFVNHLFQAFHPYQDEIDFSADKKENLRSLKGMMIAYIAEFDETNKADISTLKSIITMKSANTRDPYDKEATQRYYHHSLISSCNFENVLRDSSGNRRYIIFDIDNIDWSYRQKVNPQDLLNQAYYLAQIKYKASDESLAALNEAIEAETPVDMLDLALQEINEIIAVHERAKKLNPYQADKNITWSDISDQVMRVVRNYGFKPKTIQTAMKRRTMSAKVGGKMLYFSADF